MGKKGFSLIEIVISLFVMGLTITALLNVLDWSNKKYNQSSTEWKERTCLTEARLWLRNQILNSNEVELSLKKLSDSVKCPYGFAYNELKITKQDGNTYFIKIGVYEDKNRNGTADANEITSRLYCFRRRSA